MGDIIFKNITLREMLEELTNCILNKKELPELFWQNGDGEFQEIVEVDFYNRIETIDRDFTEFEWELTESRLYKKIAE